VFFSDYRQKLINECLMKIIKTTRGIILEGYGDKPATFSVDTTYPNLIKPFDENKLIILDSAISIENLLETIISHYFFDRNNPNNKEKAEKFKSLVLASEWCSFSSKRKLIIHIVNELLLLKGFEKNDYENLLRKIMNYRNAFAHGEMSTNGEIVKLKFFEGAPKIITIDDTYLSEVEKDLNTCFKMTMDLAFNIGAWVKHEKK
jgi:hypothetical protein